MKKWVIETDYLGLHFLTEEDDKVKVHRDFDDAVEHLQRIAIRFIAGGTIEERTEIRYAIQGDDFPVDGIMGGRLNINTNIGELKIGDYIWRAVPYETRH